MVFTWSFAHATLFGSIPLAILEAGGVAYHLAIAAVLYDAAYVTISSLSGYLGDIGFRRALIVASSIVTIASSLVMHISLLSRNPWDGITAKLILGVAGALATPNVTSLVVEQGVTEGKRPEYILARWYGFPSALGWLAAYASSSLATRLFGLDATVPLAVAASILCVPVVWSMPPQPATLEHSIAKVKARIRSFHERLLHAHLPTRMSLARLVKSPLFLFAVSVATGFAGIGLFFSEIQAYWRNIRGLSNSDILLYAALHTATSTAMFIAAHRVIELTGPHVLLSLSFAARAFVFSEPLLTEWLDPRLQATLIYVQTGATWSLLNTSLNTAALDLRIGGRGTRLGIAQSAASTGLIIGEVLAAIVAYLKGVRACFILAALFELLAAILYLVTRPWRGG